MKRFIFSLALVCATSVWAAPDWVRGEITKLAPEKAQLTVKHEASMGMAAMAMPYKVKNAAVLNGFKVGDAVRFTTSAQGDPMLIEMLEHGK
jgi:Cu/Ag efflux protein CusF